MVEIKAIPSRGFTPKYIESLRPRDDRYEVSDPMASGLKLRVYPSGVKSFRWVVNSLKRVVTIGPWSMTTAPGHVTLGEARMWLERLKAARLAGVAELDRVQAQLEKELQPPASQVEVAGVTVAQVAENFLRVLDGQRKRPEEARYVMEKDILPVIGPRALHSLKKSDCREVVARVTGRGVKVHAGKVLGLLKQLLAYAENVEDDFTSPATNLKAANLEVENNVRGRWLSEIEIPIFWRALTPDPTPSVVPLSSTPSRPRSVPDAKTALALKLLLLTAVRTAELRLAEWRDVDLEAGLWTIPVANQKLTLKQARQAKPFVVAVPPSAIALFRELKALTGGSQWVLPGAKERGPYTDKALNRAMGRMWRSHPELSKLPLATPHDLRRTARTWLGKLGCEPHISERVLNHSLGRIARVYDRGDYLLERRAALEKLDAFVQRLLQPEATNIAFLPSANG